MYTSNIRLHTHRQLATPGLAILCFAAALPAWGQMGLGLSPMLLPIDMSAGEVRNSTLTLGNDDKAAVRYRAELLDFSVDKEATPQFERDFPGESQFSCRQWLTLNPMEGELQAHGQASVRYSIRVPAGVPARTYHCAAGFTSMLDPRNLPQGGPMGIQAAVRVVTTFYVTVGRPTPAGQIQDITLERIAGEKPASDQTAGYRALFVVANEGFTNLRGIGKVDVLAEDGNIVETLDFPSQVILPQRNQRLPMVLRNKLADGRYTIRVRANIGTGEMQEATLGFRVPLETP